MTLAFGNFLLETFIPNLIHSYQIYTKFIPSLTYHGLQVLDKTQTLLFLISGLLVKSFTNKSCYNSKIKLLIKSNKIIDLIHGWFGGIRKPDSQRMVCNYNIFINNNLLSNKTLKQNWKIFNTALTYYCFDVLHKKRWYQHNLGDPGSIRYVCTFNENAVQYRKYESFILSFKFLS